MIKSGTSNRTLYLLCLLLGLLFERLFAAQDFDRLLELALSRYGADGVSAVAVPVGFLGISTEKLHLSAYRAGATCCAE